MAEQKAMLQQNVDTVKAGYDAFNRRDFDAMLEIYDPEIVWEQDEGFVEPGTHYGHAGVRHVFDAILEGFEDFHIEVEQLFGLDDDRVLAIVRITATGNLSGVKLDNPGGHLFWLRDGKVIKLRLFLDPAEAREAAGLSAGART
jgi:ketosteroid isomerase-like protein